MKRVGTSCKYSLLKVNSLGPEKSVHFILYSRFTLNFGQNQGNQQENAKMNECWHWQGWVCKRNTLHGKQQLCPVVGLRWIWWRGNNTESEPRQDFFLIEWSLPLSLNGHFIRCIYETCSLYQLFFFYLNLNKYCFNQDHSISFTLTDCSN